VMNYHISRILIIFFISLSLLILSSFFINYGSGLEILIEYRRVRVLSAVLSGMILGIAGSYLQGCLRNPLVDHYVLGIGSGSLLLVYLSILLIGYRLGYIQLFASLGGLLSLALTIALAELIGGSDVAYVLSGMGVNALFSGASILLTYLVSMRYPFAIHLLIGSFATSSVKNIPYLALALSILIATYPLLAKPLNALVLGDYYATQLGFHPIVYRRVAVIVAGVASSIVVSIHGLIGFIGLIAPHIARYMLKTVDHRFTMIMSGLIGALLLLATDSFVRIVLSEYFGEIPSGAVVSVFGAPFFLSLVVKRFKRGYA